MSVFNVKKLFAFILFTVFVNASIILPFLHIGLGFIPHNHHSRAHRKVPCHDSTYCHCHAEKTGHHAETSDKQSFNLVPGKTFNSDHHECSICLFVKNYVGAENSFYFISEIISKNEIAFLHEIDDTYVKPSEIHYSSRAPPIS